MHRKAIDVNGLFKLTIQKYQHPSGTRDFFAPNSEPSVDAKPAIFDVSSMSSYEFLGSIKKSCSSWWTSWSVRPFGGYIGQTFAMPMLQGHLEC